MKFKRQELFNLLSAFVKVKNLKGAKFAYAIIKNQEKIKREIIAFNKNNAPKPAKEYNEWERARIELCNKHCAKKNDKPIITDNKFVGLEKNPNFEKELEELKKKYKTTLDDYQKQVNEYNTKIGEEIEFDLHQVNKDELPAEISTVQLEGILAIVKE